MFWPLLLFCMYFGIVLRQVKRIHEFSWANSSEFSCLKQFICKTVCVRCALHILDGNVWRRKKCFRRVTNFLQVHVTPNNYLLLHTSTYDTFSYYNKSQPHVLFYGLPFVCSHWLWTLDISHSCSATLHQIVPPSRLDALHFTLFRSIKYHLNYLKCFTRRNVTLNFRANGSTFLVFCRVLSDVSFFGGKWTDI